jgi:hypothetical protein
MTLQEADLTQFDVAPRRNMSRELRRQDGDFDLGIDIQQQVERLYKLPSVALDAGYALGKKAAVYYEFHANSAYNQKYCARTLQRLLYFVAYGVALRGRLETEWWAPLFRS